MHEEDDAGEHRRQKDPVGQPALAQVDDREHDQHRCQQDAARPPPRRRSRRAQRPRRAPPCRRRRAPSSRDASAGRRGGPGLRPPSRRPAPRARSTAGRRGRPGGRASRRRRARSRHARAGDRQPRGVDRVVDEVDHDLAGRAATRARHGSSPVPPMPTDVALTTRSAAGTSSSVPTRPGRPASAAASSPPPELRFTTATSAAPASATAATTARPRRRHRAPPPAGHRPTSAERRRTRRRRCCGRRGGPSRPRRSSTAPSRAAAGVQLVADARRDVLQRHRDRQPGQRRARPHPRSAASGVTFGDLEGDVGPVEPEGGEGGVVQDRRQRVADGRAEHRADAGGGGQLGQARAQGMAPAALALATFAS